MTKKELIEYATAHPSAKVKLAACDIDGVLRGKYISADKFKSVVDSGLGFCDVVFGWDSSDAAYDNTRFTGWHTGYPDMPLRLDLNTFRKSPGKMGCLFYWAILWMETGMLPRCARGSCSARLSNNAKTWDLNLFLRRSLNGSTSAKHRKACNKRRSVNCNRSHRGCSAIRSCGVR